MYVSILLSTLLQTLIKWDTNITLAINGLHCGYLDNFMMMYSGKFIWIPLYVSLLVIMFRNFPRRAVIYCILFAVLLITLCDQTASAVLRPLFDRLRPANLANPISPMIHIVDGYRGGRHGFPSAHSANCWSAFFFVAYVFRRRVLNFNLAAWAFLMCWSRVYLGVHYFGDVLCGMVLGFLLASVVYYVFQLMLRQSAQSLRPKDDSPKLYTPALVFNIETAVMLILAIFTRFSF